ncbi:hypothetical protein PVE_R2G0132 [Pseudomonas veronii 1YdBTEX2]|uniref:Uncharacterized protein n=1 Tax=Pseudomonas veronii 1YdBTEX2 TaxID=1295141 RepID=A0A1D3K7H7_PSEVE|nr:hypothetical protein PVE_R2G0132 [Pseudomonas veronii 1YdBTEX2]
MHTARCLKPGSYLRRWGLKKCRAVPLVVFGALNTRAAIRIIGTDGENRQSYGLGINYLNVLDTIADYSFSTEVPTCRVANERGKGLEVAITATLTLDRVKHHGILDAVVIQVSKNNLTALLVFIPAILGDFTRDHPICRCSKVGWH